MKKLEAELRLKDRMAAVGELSAGIAHEIRNPLAAIAGSVQVLKKLASLTPQEQRLMSIVLKESERLNKSISDFLRFVRPQEKRAARVRRRRESRRDARPARELAGAATRSRDPPRDRAAVVPLVGDADQIRQVFWNLARNAVQAMPHGGHLTVRTTSMTSRTHHLQRQRPRDVAADLQRLFQPFRTNFPSGTGLGMAISYRIVQEHGGRIEVTSTRRLGDAITVSLPIVASTAFAVGSI
jgi:two-component system sensor histidine kinase PilS (NtrC family)